MKILKELRRLNNMTQDELAEKLSVSRSAVSMWEIEASKPDSENVRRLADIFNITIDYLLGRTGDPSPPEEPVKTEQTAFKDYCAAAGLSPESEQDLRKHVELLKIRDMQKRNIEVSGELSIKEWT
ncbi:MAG: helix-turn-helix domain-containing protein [Oscillospiraceae bacterium]|nr:helix-turn-helix domain-containing protein [Oscillospiraceae bacterium]